MHVLYISYKTPRQNLKSQPCIYIARYLHARAACKYTSYKQHIHTHTYIHKRCQKFHTGTYAIVKTNTNTHERTSKNLVRAIAAVSH